jgi:phage tail sheath protein FI
MPMGSASATVINYAIGVAEDRKDFVVCFSPESTDVVNNAGDEVDVIIAFADTVTASTYGIMDGNWKYQYNKYLDNYVYVPCNADVAGLLARTDRDRAPWFSPAGYTNGNILNSVKLAWNPNETNRDLLYKRGVNPIFTQPGRGTVLFGDKTFVTTDSSFNRINVRRLFITIRESIGAFAGNVLFEQNDAQTREAFLNAVEPYLRSVVGGRGITEFRVVCDESNNPPAVTEANEFVADIFVRPISSINFIQLNFVSVRGASNIAEV